MCAIFSMLEASILESNNSIPGAGLLHFLTCNWHSFSCSHGCLSCTQLEALGLCCLWTLRLLNIWALLGPTHIPSRGCLQSRTQLGLCCLWIRTCFMSRPVLGQKHHVRTFSALFHAILPVACTRLPMSPTEVCVL